jgi:hypothetical protein
MAGPPPGKGSDVKQANRWMMLSALMLAFSVVGCDCGGDPPVTPPDDTDAGTDGGVTDPPDGGQCLSQGSGCTANVQCCTGVCGADGLCDEPNQLCRSAGEACGVGGDCCTNICRGGTCASSQCLDVGGACTSPEDCCTKTCTGGTCAEIPGSSSQCKVLGQACTQAADCCSTNCQGGVCARAYSCKAYNDVCQSNAECCGGACSATDGGAGRCLFITGGGGGGCRQDGNPCSDGSTCCSRTCVDLGYGAKVCQPVGGCKLTGNFCTDDDNCCGGGVNPNGSVMCAGGRCDNGQSCNGVGNICGAGRLPDGGTTDINASQNCCDGRKEVCKVDSSGVPRCFGGGSTTCPTGYTGTEPCCIADNAVCQFSDQCCNGALCLPSDTPGVLKCQRPTCSPLGTTCTRGADGGSGCCLGTECLAVDELSSACQVRRPPTGTDGGTGGTDGGTGGTDGGTTCRANETSCTSPAQCCSGICTGGVCKAPALCQPQNAACTSGADCCQGLRCEVPNGAVTGTCQLGATCSASGQACSPTQACCSGLACEGQSGAACNGTEPCLCTVIIN